MKIRKTNHAHEWKIVGVANSDYNDTVVLYRCECKEIRTKTFEGRWSLEQLTAKGSK
jgi:hypothetical protein